MLGRTQGGGELTHHIRAVEVVGDFAKALGLALGAEHAAGFVQAFQCGVALGVDAHAAVDNKAGGARLHGQMAIVQLIISGGQCAVIQRQAQQL